MGVGGEAGSGFAGRHELGFSSGQQSRQSVGHTGQARGFGGLGGGLASSAMAASWISTEDVLPR